METTILLYLDVSYDWFLMCFLLQAFQCCWIQRLARFQTNAYLNQMQNYICVLFTIGAWVGVFFAILCFSQWGESKKREPAACWLLSQNACVSYYFVEGDISTLLSQIRFFYPKQNINPNIITKGCFFPQLLRFQYETYHVTTEYVNFCLRV